MKCPKCGSENTSQGTVGYKFMCWDCDKTFLITEKELYQQRLDKVLEKFEEVSPSLFQIELEHTQYGGNDESILINHNALNKLFYFTTHVILNIGCNTEKIVNVEYLISLDTVEHLIADMEAQK